MSSLSAAELTTSSVRSVPVVDIGALMACKDDAEIAAMLRDGDSFGVTLDALRSALTEWGFFYVSSHRLAPELTQRFRSEMERFFKLPRDAKLALERDARNPFGYYDNEFTKNKKDWKEVFDASPRYDQPDDEEKATDYLTAGVHNKWPDETLLPTFKATYKEYFYSVERIAHRLLMLVAVTLGEKSDFFDQFFYRNSSTGRKDKNTNGMRLNYYPVAPDPEQTMGVYHHTDAGALTLLLQDDDVASLQVFHRGSQQWCGVPPIKDTFVINIGDMIQVWSNDKYAAPLHRVLASDSKERYSTAFFLSPSFAADIRPVLVDAHDSPKYKELNWRQYINEKIAGNFANLAVEDPQISHYRIGNAA